MSQIPFFMPPGHGSGAPALKVTVYGRMALEGYVTPPDLVNVFAR